MAHSKPAWTHFPPALWLPHNLFNKHLSKSSQQCWGLNSQHLNLDREKIKIKKLHRVQIFKEFIKPSVSRKLMPQVVIISNTKCWANKARWCGSNLQPRKALLFANTVQGASLHPLTLLRQPSRLETSVSQRHLEGSSFVIPLSNDFQADGTRLALKNCDKKLDFVAKRNSVYSVCKYIILPAIIKQTSCPGMLLEFFVGISILVARFAFSFSISSCHCSGSISSSFQTLHL